MRPDYPHGQEAIREVVSVTPRKLGFLVVYTCGHEDKVLTPPSLGQRVMCHECFVALSSGFE